jgi:hypothetical protein
MFQVSDGVTSQSRQLGKLADAKPTALARLAKST